LAGSPGETTDSAFFLFSRQVGREAGRRGRVRRANATAKVNLTK
jgi:hypothetical protein